MQVKAKKYFAWRIKRNSIDFSAPASWIRFPLDSNTGKKIMTLWFQVVGNAFQKYGVKKLNLYYLPTLQVLHVFHALVYIYKKLLTIACIVKNFSNLVFLAFSSLKQPKTNNAYICLETYSQNIVFAKIWWVNITFDWWSL